MGAPVGEIGPLTSDATCQDKLGNQQTKTTCAACPRHPRGCHESILRWWVAAELDPCQREIDDRENEQREPRGQIGKIVQWQKHGKDENRSNSKAGGDKRCAGSRIDPCKGERELALS